MIARDLQNFDSLSTSEIQTSTVPQTVDLVRQENSEQNTIIRAISKFPQSSEGDDESSIDEEMEEKIQKAEELHQAIKDRASRLGRRKVPQRLNLNNIPYYSTINPSSASLQSHFTNDKPATNLQNRNRPSTKKSRRCFGEMLLDTGKGKSINLLI